MNTTRAKKGGQVGVNGESYKGGRFLPRNPDRAKVEGSKPRKARKIEIEPYVWIEAPEGFVSLYSALTNLVAYDRASNTFASSVDPQPFAYYHRHLTGAELDHAEARLVNLAAAYNRGERVTLAL